MFQQSQFFKKLFAFISRFLTQTSEKNGGFSLCFERFLKDFESPTKKTLASSPCQCFVGKQFKISN